jgi:hypothetical protein
MTLLRKELGENMSEYLPLLEIGKNLSKHGTENRTQGERSTNLTKENTKMSVDFKNTIHNSKGKYIVFSTY